jgi:hypothetical protein
MASLIKNRLTSRKYTQIPSTEQESEENRNTVGLQTFESDENHSYNWRLSFEDEVNPSLHQHKLEAAKDKTLSKKDQIDRWRELVNYFILLTWRTIKKSKINFCLGFFACFIVVVIVAVLITVLGNTPVVFLKLAELQVRSLF